MHAAPLATLWAFYTETGAEPLQRLTNSQRTSLEEETQRNQSRVNQAEEYLLGRGFTKETIAAARLGVDDDGRLAIPYLTRAGVVDIRTRCLRSHNCSESYCAKYRSRAGAVAKIFGVQHLVTAGPWLCVTEGELDSLILGQLGYPAVGVPGAGNWKHHWRRVFEDFSRIFVFCDGDEAGKAFGSRFCTEIPLAEMVICSPKQDVNSTFLTEGRSYFDGILR